MKKNEFYTSGVIKEMINDSIFFKNIEIQNKYYFSLGTPEQVNEFEHPFIFDLDGTLVNTDHIYTLVWNDIMKKYKLSVDNKFFNFFIQGKNDVLFLKEIFPMINNETIEEISSLKDTLFINYLDNHQEDIMICGAKEFINRNKNRKMGIVTSCNKKSAEFILRKTKLDEYMQFLIASEDCKEHKPNKEPYEKAIEILQCSKSSCTIFEDSNSGYKSAKSIGDTNICLITSNKSDNNILNADEYKIKSYHNFDYNNNYFNSGINNKNNNNNNNKLYTSVMEALNFLPIKKVVLNNKDIKPGYICDIKSFNIHSNNKVENIILKIENIDNELSDIARKINLYSNELFFYNKLSSIINIPIPKFYSSLVINEKKGILLENLNEYEGEFNINLNNDIDLLLLVVKNAVCMHNYFYFKNEEEIIPSMKGLLKINEILYYKTLIDNRYRLFLEMNNCLLLDEDINIINRVYSNYSILIEKTGTFPLNFCHGDFKSPNIFYKRESCKNIIPFFLDWQYIHLNKGISDIAFLLVESTDFNKTINDIVIKYYYTKTTMYDNLEDLMQDFKISLCIFPFFVMVWFNSENRDNLLDKIFPIRFMKNLLKFYNNYLDEDFFQNL
jgi:HAD superfamily hydrolase (TIGR01549 family)